MWLFVAGHRPWLIGLDHERAATCHAPPSSLLCDVAGAKPAGNIRTYGRHGGPAAW
jgi:hypothetical protein